MKGVCQQLIKTDMEGQLKNQDLLVWMLQTAANNFNKMKLDQRHKSSVQQFYKVLLLWGGPRLAQFVAMNLVGPEIQCFQMANICYLVYADGAQQREFQ